MSFDKMEEALGRQIAENKIGEDRKKMNALRVYRQSEEIKEMQRKITAALVNKERSAQISEGQYRRQLDLVSHQSPLIIGYRNTIVTLIKLSCKWKKCRTKSTERPKRNAKLTASKISTICSSK